MLSDFMKPNGVKISLISYDADLRKQICIKSWKIWSKMTEKFCLASKIEKLLLQYKMGPLNLDFF